jgi:hypothetical protein
LTDQNSQAQAHDGDQALARDFDIGAVTRAFADDPFPTYRALLEHAPVKRFAD